MPKNPPPDATPIEDLARQVAKEVGGDEEQFLPGWATFKRDDNGLYYEGRCVRGHIKDCAAQVVSFVSNIKAFRSKVANKVYVETERIYLGKSEPDGMEQRFIQVMTRQGPRSSYKYIDYVEKPRLEFILRVLGDDVIAGDEISLIFEYGGMHGMGQERSQDWGRYEVVEITEVE